MTGLLRPIAGHQVTQEFDGDHHFEPAGSLGSDAVGPRRARRKPFHGGVARAHLHGGVDIKCDPGTTIRAPERGKVVATGRYKETGEKYLMLQIRRGTVLFFTHLSAHIAHEKDRVERGDPIALSGNTGMSTGPHLHWEVRVTRRKHPKPRASGRWFKLDPRRLQVNGDLAGLPAIRPRPLPPAASPVDDDDDEEPATTDDSTTDADGPTVTDPDADDDQDDDADAPDDDFGDEALRNEQQAGVAPPPTEDPEPQLGGPAGHQ